MRLAIIGYGQAGGKVLDRFLEYDQRTQGKIVAFPLVINSAKSDLQGLQYVPTANRILIGQSRVKGHGVGTDNELGYEIAREDIDEIQRAIDDIPVHEVDAFLIIAGLGGGTGSGGAPVLAERLDTLYAEPVYGLGILPARDEGGIYSLNAARSVKTFVNVVDNLLLFDNDAWRKSGESVSSGYEEINHEIVKRFGVLFSSGEVDDRAHVGESIVDASEVINTLGSGGLSTVGFSSSQVRSAENRGLLGRLSTRPEEIDAGTETNRIVSLIRSATLGRLTVPCEISDADRVLVVVAGPPEYLNRKGIERGRKWLEEETGCMVVRGGDYPVAHSNYVAAAVLLSGVTDIPRLSRLQTTARATIESVDARNLESDRQLRDLLDDDNAIEPLF